MASETNDTNNHNGLTDTDKKHERGQLVPMQFRRLRRFGVLVGCLLVGLVLLRVWWGYEANRRLEAEIKRYQAAGQIVYASEFDAVLDAIPADNNAALLYEEAMNATTSTTASGVSIDEFYYEPDTFHKKPDAAEELIESNTNVLRLVREARSRRQVAWSHRLQGGAAIGPMSSQRSLAKLLYFAASYHHRTGDHAEAVETMHDLLAFGDAVATHPTLISNLVAWACHGLGLSHLEEHGALLTVDGAMATDQEDGTRPANREQIQGLITTLLDEESSRSSLAQAFLGDRAWMLDLREWARQASTSWTLLAPASAWSCAMDFLQDPLLELDVARGMRHDTLLSKAAAAPSWPLAAKQIPVESESPSLVDELAHPWTSGALGTNSRSLTIYFKHLAQRRMGAIALAIRLFELDHGHRPSNLSTLVPDYLPAVPADPFSAAGATIRYKPDAKPPVLYSVGVHGVDNGGVIVTNPDGTRSTDNNDILFHLDGRPKNAEDEAPEDRDAGHR